MVHRPETTAVKFVEDSKDQEATQKVPCLTILEGAGVGEVYKIENPPILIGRDAGCHIRIWEDEVSRQHAKVDRVNKLWVVADLGSTNGTYVNGTKVDQNPAQRRRQGSHGRCSFPLFLPRLY